MSTYSCRRKLQKPSQKQKQGDHEDNNNSNNRLLAGYLASEFLTQGTIFGHPVGAPQAAPFSIDVNRSESLPVNRKCYDEVMNLLKSEGTQVPGIVNPSQLGLWLRNVS
ncbi:hypothetical protein ACHQM5_027600 [Ranunculus cassubicifolius]